ncbi:MAG: PKD domain-containing protein, partial [Ekhidna sp.]|nr:PKD domain-containing protein [Ekhidna sp.]
QELTIYPEPPTPTFEVTSAGTLCTNNELTLRNTTDETGYDDVLTYQWVIDGDVVDQRDTVYTFTTSGVKTITLQAFLPGCSSVVETQEAFIIAGPEITFTASPACENEVMQFTNGSVDAVSYLWDFGDGFTSTAENPDHVFTMAGNYDVSLTGTNASGCVTTHTVSVTVSDLPQVNFDFETPCTSDGGILFMDLSTVNNADVIGWQWFLNGDEVSTEQNPTLHFSESGVSTVMLAVTSSNGCEATYIEDIEVFQTPSPDFAASIGCVGEETLLLDLTSFPEGTITSWLWSVNGEDFFTKDVSFVFDEAGIYDITLETIGNNFCSESITKSIEILTLPTIDFDVTGDCDNIVVAAQDLSFATNDAIVSRTWLLDGQEVGNGSNLLLNNLAAGAYDLALQVETASGCFTSGSQALEINSSPSADFTFLRTYGIPDDVLTFSNNSTGAVNYQWFLNESLQGTSASSESFTFTESGTYAVRLVAENSLGCTDTIMQEVLIAIPVVDLSIRNFDLLQENGTGKILLEIENLSNLPIDSVVVDIELENRFQVKEQVNRFIDIGGSTSFSLNVGIPLDISEPAYFCVSLASPFMGFEDSNPFNNEKCLTIAPQVKIENPYPNPVRDEFVLKVIIPQDEVIKLTLLNSAGKLETEKVTEAMEGLS